MWRDGGGGTGFLVPYPSARIAVDEAGVGSSRRRRRRRRRRGAEEARIRVS